MAVFNCKMCGAPLNVVEGASVAVCEYCMAEQTLPKVNDEVLQNLFNRANNLRSKCEFDKAAEIYEKILQESENEAEAHWGLILCKYGIEYVEDPATKKRIPTCHRASYEAVVSDPEYKAAIDNADMLQKSVYEAEAKAIDEIQKGILAISQNEEPFDIFICYKRSDENKERTRDSVAAQEIYFELTNAGYKVFFAEITLEDKLGIAYEPYIFAALNSAKIMLVVGSKPEYFNAVWVKNEWSRYLKLMKNDRSRLLIPCYKDMNAYDLPEEFAHLQAQDMGKLGFVTDLIRGIKKVIVKDAPKQTSDGITVASLLKNAEIYISDRDFSNAKTYCRKVLDRDPENGKAYILLLLCDLNLTDESALPKQTASFESNNNYQKAVRFSDAATQVKLKGYLENAKANAERLAAEEAERKRLAEEERQNQLREEARQRAAETMRREEEENRRKQQEEKAKAAKKALEEKRREEQQTRRTAEDAEYTANRVIANRWFDIYYRIQKGLKEKKEKSVARWRIILPFLLYAIVGVMFFIYRLSGGDIPLAVCFTGGMPAWLVGYFLTKKYCEKPNLEALKRIPNPKDTVREGVKCAVRYELNGTIHKIHPTEEDVKAAQKDAQKYGY